jgi:C4-type Zn-finger protein
VKIVKVLFYLCDNCKSPQVIHPAAESALPYTSALICSECGYEHTDLKDLKNFAKATGELE